MFFTYFYSNQFIFKLEDENNLTALHIACKNGNEEIASLLIDKTDIKNFTISNNLSLPIHFLCKSKNEKLTLIKKILDRLKNECYEEFKNVLIKQDINKQTILNIAIENNHLNIIESLFKEYYLDGKDLEDKNSNLPIHYAAKCGSTDVLEILWKNNAFSLKTNQKGENALHIAASNNKFKFIKSFLKYEKDYLKSEKTLQTLSFKCLNQNKHSPLFLAIINGHLKCVEILAMLEDTDLNAKDMNGNSIYHKCAEYNHYESLRFLLTRKGKNFLELIYLKNENDETVLHIAAEHENLEIIKLVLSKLYDGFMSTETFLTSKNKQGKTFFQIACSKGYHNIVEYFLKDLKMHFFLEHQDNEMNTPLHLASENGHLSIVNILLYYGIELNTKNKNNKSALELSCRRGFFEVSKILISRYSEIKNEDKMVDDPLLVASHEGAHEVVKLLLMKGASIQALNNDKKNCLDIAIEKDHREVIRILLKNENWIKLFHTTLDDDKYSNNIIESYDKNHKKLNLKAIYRKENPQFNAMVDKKMWDMLKIVLDNCKDGDNYDFTILDPNFKSSSTHPLILIAESGQEVLIKHETIKMLLNLKWRYFPRMVFYINIFFYLIFIVLFSMYTIQLSKRFEEIQEINYFNNNSIIINEFEHELNLFGITFESKTGFYLILVFLLTFIKKIFQILLIDGFSFFLSFPNWVELSTFAFSFTSVLSSDFKTKFTFGSIAILLAYIEFSFLIQKFKVFGLYVLAFKRTLKNSAKFFPMFLLIFIGFILSFRLLSNFGVTYLNTNSGSYIIKVLAMAVGELETSGMGLDEGLFVNYLIYTLFIWLNLILKKC
jgi:ankyrin repeat protein